MKPLIPALVLATAASTGLAIAFDAAAADAEPATGTTSLDVSSPAFGANAGIPVEYTCDGGETAPGLAWTQSPANTRSIAVLVDDPDAPHGTVTHWLVTGIPATTTSLPKGGRLPAAAVAAANTKGKHGYMGPCPPDGMHHYHFRVFALDITPDKSVTPGQFATAIQGHVVAQGELIGTYQR